MRRPTPRRSRAGVSLVEVAVSLVILILVVGAAFGLNVTTNRAYSTATDEAEVTERLSTALADVAEVLRRAGSSTVIPGLDQGGFVTEMDFAIVDAYAAGAVTYGALQTLQLQDDPGDPDDGVDNDGDGLVDEDRLVWITGVGTADQQTTVLCLDIPILGDGETAVDGADDDGDGQTDEPGFMMVSSDDDAAVSGSVTIEMSLVGVTSDGQQIRQSAIRTVAFRNP